MQDDAALLGALKLGEPEACTFLFDTYADRIYRLALGLLQDPGQAEDVVQETCLKVLTHAVRFEGRSSLGTWMYRLAYNASTDRLRRKEENPLPSEDAGEEEDLSFPMPQNFVEWQTPEALVIGGENRHILEQAVAQLPESMRMVFMLRDIEALSTAAAAEVLGISDGLVKVRLHRARLSLRERLAPYFAGPEVAQKERSHEL